MKICILERIFIRTKNISFCKRKLKYLKYLKNNKKIKNLQLIKLYVIIFFAHKENNEVI